MTTGTMVGRGSLTDPRPVWAGVGASVLVLTIALSAPALAIVLTLPIQAEQDGLLQRAEQACYVAGFTILAVTGSVLLHRRPRHSMGWLLAAAGVAQLLTILVMATPRSRSPVGEHFRSPSSGRRTGSGCRLIVLSCLFCSGSPTAD